MPAPLIYVDADACPVRNEAERVAARHGVAIVFVANQGSRPTRDPMVRHVYVPQGADVADDWIVEHAGRGDIVVTSDIPLAGRVLELGAEVMRPNGKPFTHDSIGMALAMRDLHQHLRETGASRGINAEFTPRDRSDFLSALDAAVNRAKRRSEPE